MNNKVILIRSNPVLPDPPVEKMANTLVKLGYSVTILAWDRDKSYKQKSESLLLDSGEVPVIRFGIPAVFGGGLKKNLIPLLCFMQRLKEWLKNNKRQYDIIHAFDFDTGFLASKYAKKFDKKFIYHILDFYVASHNLANSNLGKIIEKKEISVINEADGVIVCTESRKEQIKAAKPKLLYVIHNTPQNISVSESDIIIKGNREKCRIVYVGILGSTRFIMEIAKFVRKYKEFEFHIGGFGKREADVAELAAQNANIFFYGKLQYAQTLALEKACDIITAIYDPRIPNHQYAAPNKLYESLMLGKPIIMARNTGWDDVINNYDIGELIDYSPKDLERGLLKLYSKKDKWPEMSQRSQALYKIQYSWDIMEQRIKELYNNI